MNDRSRPLCRERPRCVVGRAFFWESHRSPRSADGQPTARGHSRMGSGPQGKLEGGTVMIRMEASTVIKRPVDEVFAYVTDANTWKMWMGFEAEQTSEGPVGVGTTFKGVSEFMGRTSEWTLEVTSLEPNSALEQRMKWGSVSMEQRIAFEPVDGDTKLSMAGQGETGGFLKLADPIVKRTAQRQWEASLGRLKEILEAEA